MAEFLDPGLQRLAGDELVHALASQGRWDVLETMWRSGDVQSALRAGRLLAASAVPSVVDLVAAALLDPVAGQPERHEIVEMLTESTCTAELADEILASTLEPERREPATITLWLLRQPGREVDSHAIDLVSDTSCAREVRNAAASRCFQNTTLRQPALVVLSAIDREDPSRWVETIELLARVVGTARVAGVSDLRRTLVNEYFGYPAIAEAEGFTKLVLGKPQVLLDTIAAAERLHPEQSGGAAQLLVRASQASDDPEFRVDLAISVAERHVDFWALHHPVIVASWGPTEWHHFLTALPARTDTGANLSFSRLIECCDDDCLDTVAAVNAAVHLDLDDGAGNNVEAVGARLSRSIDRDSADNLAALDWPPTSDPRWPVFRTLIARAIPDAGVRAELMGSLVDSAVITPGSGAELVVAGHRLQALDMIADAELGTGFVSAVMSIDPEAAAELGAPLSEAHDIVLVRGLAPTSPEPAFVHVARTWNDMSDTDRDVVLDLLEQHGTVSQSALLDMIVSDTSGRNRDRRARAGQRWARLVPLGTPFPAGISSLLGTGIPALARTVASIAAEVRPSDHDTLVALRDRWATADPGDPVRAEFRSALDAIDASLASDLGALERGTLVQEGPAICRALGITAGPNGFAALTSLVGPDSRDDEVDLRRAAAAALREYFSAHPGEASNPMIETLGRLAVPDGGELDSAARADLSAAFRSASLGEDAALAMLDPHISGQHDIASYLGAEKPAAVAALNGVASRRAQGAAGYSGLVQQLDVVVEHVARATYLLVGPSENMKQQIRSQPGIAGSLPYARVIDGLKQVVPVAHLQVLHDLRSNKTEAHGADQLTDGDVRQAEDSFGEAVSALYAVVLEAWTGSPNLKVIDDPSGA